LLNCYFTATNYYHNEYVKLKKARSTADQFGEISRDDA